jgi:phage shock protein A
MAGLMSRASLILQAKFSKLLNRAENPNETLDYSYEQQLQLLQNVKRGIADVVTSKKRLQMQTEQLEQSVVKLETQARQALGQNREDLARQALERKSAVQQQLQGLDVQVKQLEEQQQKLVSNEQQLQSRIEAFRTQKEVIKAQYSAAEAQVKIGEAATGIGKQMADTGLAIQRAQDKTQEMQARASAVDELIASGTLEDFTAGGQTQLDKELAELSSQSQVDSDLARLKSELGAGEETPAIESGGDATAKPAEAAPAAAEEQKQ